MNIRLYLGQLYFATLCTTGLISGSISAATVAVINSHDSLAGSLRQAIQDANPGDTIVFQIPVTDPGYSSATGLTTITLTSGSGADSTTALTIAKDLTIDGAGAKIVLARSSASGTPKFRIFGVTAGTVTFRNLTIYNGNAEFGSGGGISNQAHLTVSECALGNNFALNTGGGIENYPGGVLDVINSTLYSNTTNQNGRAIDDKGAARIIGSTISLNPAPGVSGTAAVHSGGNTHVGNTIIAGNSVSSAGGDADVAGSFISEGYNFIGDPLGSSGNGSSGFGLSGSHDQIGTHASPAIAQLAAIAFGIGPTPYFQPVTGSPVIDQGNRGVDANGQPINLDQRGLPRPADQPGIANAGDGSDIGAVEVGLAQPGPTFTVTTTNEHNDGVCSTDDCALVEALNATNANADANTINFAPGVTGTILNTLVPGGLNITNPVTINGPGAPLLTISGNNAARIFNVAIGATATISGLSLDYGDTIAPGLSDNSGGAIENFGTLTLDRCELDHNSGGSGGAVANIGTLTITNCGLNSNQSTGNGGALRNVGNMTVTNSTIAANDSVYSGAISSFVNTGGPATAMLTNCTVYLNSATGSNGIGGGLNNGVNSTMTVRNTLVAFNVTQSSAHDSDLAGAFVSGGHNLIYRPDASSGFTNGVNGDMTGASYNFNLGAPATNGGPTYTVALLLGCSAINNGNDANAPATDQRGFIRNGISDIGAFEFGGTLPVAKITSITHLSNGHIILQGLGVANASATIEASSTPDGGSFMNIGTTTADAMGVLHYDDADAVGLTRRFYRLALP
ncbi:MAG: choice-of-anchor Q domain-containing protein [Chthoniobacterales bacterium]